MTGDQLRKIQDALPEITELMWESDDKINRGIATIIQGCVEEDDEQTMLKTIYAYEDRLTDYVDILTKAWDEAEVK